VIGGMPKKIFCGCVFMNGGDAFTSGMDMYMISTDLSGMVLTVDFYEIGIITLMCR
jgi:hypothetical protein